jgi:pimeloyl-ACP methyl ester carboxylesterase
MADWRNSIDWNQPEMIASNGIDLALYQSGPEDSTLPPLVFAHGFPELAFSWRHQLAGLGAAGFRCLAPDQRGYGRSARPQAVEAYDMENLCADLVGLLDAKGIEKAIFVGHDWGGMIAWAMPLRHPDRVAGVIGLNTPYTKRPDIDPIELYKQRFGPDMYIVRFQEPGVIDAIFDQDVKKTMQYFMRGPDISPTAFQARPAERRNLALQEALKRFKPENDTQQFLAEDELAYFTDRFSHTGFTGGINWYRNFTRNWERGGRFVDHVPHPALMIMAEMDVVLPPSAANGMEKYVPDLEKTLITGSGHWTQQEKPDAVNAAISEWVKRRFG